MHNSSCAAATQQEMGSYLVTLVHKAQHQLCICLRQVELYWPLAPCLLIFMMGNLEAQNQRLSTDDDQSVAPAPLPAAVWVWARPLVAGMQHAPDACQSEGWQEAKDCASQQCIMQQPDCGQGVSQLLHLVLSCCLDLDNSWQQSTCCNPLVDL